MALSSCSRGSTPCAVTVYAPCCPQSPPLRPHIAHRVPMQPFPHTTRPPHRCRIAPRPSRALLRSCYVPPHRRHARTRRRYVPQQRRFVAGGPAPPSRCCHTMAPSRTPAAASLAPHGPRYPLAPLSRRHMHPRCCRTHPRHRCATQQCYFVAVTPRCHRARPRCCPAPACRYHTRTWGHHAPKWHPTDTIWLLSDAISVISGPNDAVSRANPIPHPSNTLSHGLGTVASPVVLSSHHAPPSSCPVGRLAPRPTVCAPAAAGLAHPHVAHPQLGHAPRRRLSHVHVRHAISHAPTAFTSHRWPRVPTCRPSSVVTHPFSMHITP
ncbi:hypothetical protein DENSPDRAFT_624717 [Dentipellis sp. KUC8613]|nr:hypothetical protein DENSPDRAFT_624717 [Dentipellis sp. KUC8613]